MSFTRLCYLGKKDDALQLIADKIPAIVVFMEDKKFLAGDDPVWLDFYWFETIELMLFVTDGDLFKDFPSLETYHQNVVNLPGLLEYLDDPNCPEKTRYFNNKHAKINNEVCGKAALDRTRDSRP